jgi:transposase
MITQTVIHPDAAGIDLASEVHYVAVPADRDPQPVRNFGTTTDQLIVLADWLQRGGIRTVAMEATGVYWIPLFELLEARGLEVCLVNRPAWRSRSSSSRSSFFWRRGIGTRTGRCSARNERRGR